MDRILLCIIIICIVYEVDAVDEDVGPLGGYEWLILLSVVLAVLIAIVIGGFLYRRKLKKSVQSDQENPNENEDSQFHTKISEENKSQPNYGATQDVHGEKTEAANLSESSAQLENGTAKEEQISHKEEKDDDVDLSLERIISEEESLYGTAHKSSRYRLMQYTIEEGPNVADNEDQDDSDELKHMNVSEISRASLKRMVEKYISQAGDSSKRRHTQEMEEDTLYVDGAGRYLLNKDTLHLSDLGNQSITTTKKRESLNLQQNKGLQNANKENKSKNQKHLTYSWPDPKELKDLESLQKMGNVEDTITN